MTTPEAKAWEGPSVEERRQMKQQKQKKPAPQAEETPPEPHDTELKQQMADEIASLKEQLRQEQEASKENLNKLLYAQADFENYRRRLNQEVESRIDAGKARLIQNLLTVVDELELALKATKNAENTSAVVGGVEIVLKKFHDSLAAEGLSVIESVGKKFDPTVHEAVERVPCEDREEGTILEEIRKGFTMKGRLIRPSIVKIAVPQIAESDSSKQFESGSS
jgi:molecular chaperone GrpE